MELLKDAINTKVIEDYIAKNNLTKTQFCKKCKISYNTFQKVIGNKGDDFELIVLLKIARVMKVEMVDLLNKKYMS